MPFFGKSTNGIKSSTTTHQNIDSCNEEFGDNNSIGSNGSAHSSTSKVSLARKWLLNKTAARRRTVFGTNTNSSTVTVTASVPASSRGSLELNATWTAAPSDTQEPTTRYSSRNPSFSADTDTKPLFTTGQPPLIHHDIDTKQESNTRFVSARYSFPLSSQEQLEQDQLNAHFPPTFDQQSTTSNQAEQPPLHQYLQTPSSQHYNHPPRPPFLSTQSTSQSLLQSSQQSIESGSFADTTHIGSLLEGRSTSFGIQPSSGIVTDRIQAPRRLLKKPRASTKKKKKSKKNKMSSAGETSRGYASTDAFIEAFTYFSTNQRTGEYTLDVIQDARFFRYVRDNYEPRLDPKRYRRVIRQVVAPQQGYKVGCLDPRLEQLLRDEFDKLGKKKWNFVKCLSPEELEGRPLPNPVPAFDLMMIDPNQPHDLFPPTSLHHFHGTSHAQPGSRHSHRMSTSSSSGHHHKRQKSMEMDGAHPETMFFPAADMHMQVAHGSSVPGYQPHLSYADVELEPSWFPSAAASSSRGHSSSPRRKSTSSRRRTEYLEFDELETRSSSRRDKDRVTAKSSKSKSKSSKSSKSSKRDGHSDHRRSSTSSPSRRSSDEGSSSSRHRRHGRHRLEETYNYAESSTAAASSSWQRGGHSHSRHRGYGEGDEFYGLDYMDTSDYETRRR